MTKPIIRVGLIPVLLLIAASSVLAQQQATGASTPQTIAVDSVAANQEATRKLFATYPQSERLDAMIAGHLGDAQKSAQSDKAKGKLPFVVFSNSFITDNPDTSISFYVTEQGKGRRYCFSYERGLSTDHQCQLAEQQLATLRKTIRSMPPSNPPASLKDLLVLSYWIDGKRFTRLYDMTQLPPEVQSVQNTWSKDITIPIPKRSQ